MGLFPVEFTMVADKTKYVEIGRIAYIAHGDDKGKLCTIVDVIDQNRALVDGPCSNVNRQQINFKALHLTSLKMQLAPSCRAKYIKKSADNAKRAALTDFDRFKLMKAKQARNKIINVEFGKLKKAMRKVPKKVTKKRKARKPAAKK